MGRKWVRLVAPLVTIVALVNFLKEEGYLTSFSFSWCPECDQNKLSSATTKHASQQHHRYFLYNDTAMIRTKANLKTKKSAVYWREVSYESLIHKALVGHHLRTMDPNEAELFFFPTPIGQFLDAGPRTYDEAFNALLQAPTYQRLHGHRHVIIALVDHFKNVPFRKWLAKLTNVTVARSYDPNACRDLVAAAGSSYQHDYRPLFLSLYKATQTMSIGLPPEPGVPFFPATYEKFMDSSLVLFYRTTEEPSLYNSTQYRHAPVGLQELLPFPSSIGYGIPKEQWLQDLMGSQFCLVIRGDTPHSHALFTAIRVGCIPVLVSDTYPIYAPPFPATLRDMKDYCIFIREDYFLENPLVALSSSLQNLTEPTIRQKLEALAWAQRVLLVDHPESLFVEALVTEGMAKD
jgi:hypothetical protein